MRQASVLLLGAALGLGACSRVCDAPRVEAEGAALIGQIEAWSPSDGRIPDFSTPATSTLWKACGEELPAGFGGYLDFNVHHPVPPWFLEGRPEPEGATWDPVEEHLPGHARVHGGPRNGEDPRVMEWIVAVCPDVTEVSRAVVSVPASQRAATLYDGCGLKSARWLEREAFIERDIAPLDLTGLALRNYLLEQKVSPSVADALVLEVMMGKRRPEVSPLGTILDVGEVKLPWTAEARALGPLGPVWPENRLLIDASSVRARERAVARRIDGAALAELALGEADTMVSSLDDSRREEPVLLMADQATRWSLLQDLVQALRRANFEAVHLLVLVDDRAFRVQTMAIPRPASPPPEGASLQDVLSSLG